MKISDRTLRDGGYNTDWDFDKSLANIYFDSLNNLRLEYIEVGCSFWGIKKNKLKINEFSHNKHVL